MLSIVDHLLHLLRYRCNILFENIGDSYACPQIVIRLSCLSTVNRPNYYVFSLRGSRGHAPKSACLLIFAANETHHAFGGNAVDSTRWYISLEMNISKLTTSSLKQKRRIHGIKNC